MTKKIVSLLAAVFIISLFSLTYAAEEKITISTFYPSPSGSYNMLSAYKLAVGSGAIATVLSRSNGEMMVENKLSVGTTDFTYALNVAGSINIATGGDIRQGATPYTFPDYVFAPSYKLMPLPQLREFLSNNRHLPGFPSKNDVVKDGVKVFEHNRLLLEKLEESYLYIMQLEERISKLEAAKK